MSTDHVLLNKEGGLWRVTLNRPDKANALSDGMLHRLSDIFSDAASDEDLRVLVITGAGERVFCAGADLSELNTDSDDPANQVWRDLAEKLATLPALTIAMINGSCIGGALMLALGCDIRIAVPEAAFGYPVLKNGVLLGTRDAARMRALMGPGRTSMNILGGTRADAHEACAWGLVDRVVERSELDQAVADLGATALDADRAHLITLKQRCREDM